jgi:hypothetical protein
VTFPKYYILQYPHSLSLKLILIFQNGIDCGAWAAWLVLDIIKNGLDRYQARHWFLECPHVIRKNMLDCVLTHTYSCYQWWKSEFHVDWAEQPSENAQRILANGIQSSRIQMNVQLMLSCAADHCKYCNQRNWPVRRNGNALQSDSEY